jgi:glycosyltransferase involved in cell wall biosynthesis
VRPPLLVVFYANPAQYPPTYNAIRLLSEHFRVRLVCRNVERATIAWPEGVRIDRVGPEGSTAGRIAASAAEKAREYAGFALAVRRALAEDRPAVAYAYDPHAIVALRLAGCRAPIVYQRHEVEELDRLGHRSLGAWISRGALRFGRRAALLVFPDEHRAAYYTRFAAGGPPPLVVPNFPLLAVFPAIEDLPARIERRWQKKEIFYRGSIGPSTGVREAIRALEHTDPAVSLRVCGFGAPEFARELDALAASIGAADRYVNEGFVTSYEALNERTRDASLGVLLYRADSTNLRHTVSAANKLYEYAACALPAVVPDRPEYRAFLAGERWIEFADERDPHRVRVAIERVFADRGAYAARCVAARRAFEERFNYEAAFRPVLERVIELARLRS